MKNANAKNKILAMLLALFVAMPSTALAVAKKESESGNSVGNNALTSWLAQYASGISIEADARLFNQENTPQENEDGTPELNSDGNQKTDDELALKARDIHVKGSIPFGEAAGHAMKLAFRVDLARIAGLDDEASADDIEKLEEAIEQAEIVVTSTEEGALIRTIRFGKGESTLREFIQSNKLYKDSLLYELSHKDEVFGVSVEISPQVFQGIALEVALHECKEGDLELNDGDDDRYDGCSNLGVAVRNVKIGDYVSFAAEYLRESDQEIEVDGVKEDIDGQETLKLYAAVEDEDTYGKAYIKFLSLKNNAYHPEAEMAFTIGYEKMFGPGKIVIQYEDLDEASKTAGTEIGGATQWNISYNFKVGQNLTVSPYIILRDYENDGDTLEEDNETEAGVNFHIHFGKSRMIN